MQLRITRNIWQQLVTAIMIAASYTMGYSQDSSPSTKQYRLVNIHAGQSGLSLSGGSAAFEDNGIVGSGFGGQQEIAGWQGSAGLISTVKSRPVGAGTQFDGVMAGSLLLGVHRHSQDVLPAGVSIGFQENASRRSGSQLSLIESTDSPPRTLWTPPQNRIGEPANAVTPSGTHFFTLHGGVRCADEVSVAYLPVFQPVWTAETQFFLPEGPTFDSQGHAYFTPYHPDVDAQLLVSVDGETGARRFAIPGRDITQGGAPLILKQGSGEVVYTGGSERIIAASTETGAILWEQTGLLDVLATGNGAEDETRRLMGINYHAPTDSLIAAFSSGFLIALNRTTGEILGSFDLPGAPAATGDIPEDFLNTYEDEINQELESFDVREFDARSFVSVILGGDAVIANYFAVDPTSGRIWVGGTQPDEADGIVDGVSQYGALFGIDVTGGGGNISFSIAAQVGFEGGSASTAAIRGDGQRIYIADGENTVYAYDRDGNQVWSVDVGAQVVGSLAISSFGEIYAATLNGITKIRENGQSASVEWNSPLDSIYKTIPSGWATQNLNLAGVGANGVMIHTSVGPPSEIGISLPVRMSLTMLDPGTGVPVNSTQAVEESVSVMATGPDGAIVLAHSPIRRILLRVVTGGSPAQKVLAPPVIGGLAKYGMVQGFDLLARDASFAALSILKNADQTFMAGDELGGSSGVLATTALITQTETALRKALLRRELPRDVVAEAQLHLGLAQSQIDAANFRLAIEQLQITSDLLNTSRRP